MTFTYLIFYSKILPLFSHDLKLSILSNYTEYPKKLTLFVIRTTLFYNSKISIPNKSASLSEKDDFS